MRGPTDESTPSSPTVIADHAAGEAIATVLLNRPRVRNALDRRMIAELSATLIRLRERSEIRALVLVGAGERAFCAGADLRERLAMSPAERSAHTSAIADAADLLATAPDPTIAAVRGFALAGGAELALACDLRVASTDAVFGFPEVRLGIFPGAGGIVRLPVLIGLGAARDLLFTGRRIGAEEAARVGLVDRLVPPERTRGEALDLAGEIAANAPLAVRATKSALATAAGHHGEDARRIVARWRRPLDASADYAEGLSAFADGREPTFRGE